METTVTTPRRTQPAGTPRTQANRRSSGVLARYNALTRAAQAGQIDLVMFIERENAAREQRAKVGVANGRYELMPPDPGCRYAAGVRNTVDDLPYRQEQDTNGCCVCCCPDLAFVEAVNREAWRAGLNERLYCVHYFALRLLEQAARKAVTA